MAGGKPGLPCLFPCPPWKQDGEKEKYGLWYLSTIFVIFVWLLGYLSTIFVIFVWLLWYLSTEATGRWERERWIVMDWNIRTIFSEELSDMFWLKESSFPGNEIHLKTCLTFQEIPRAHIFARGISWMLAVPANDQICNKFW